MSSTTPRAATLAALVEERASTTPDSVALVDDDRSVTSAALHAESAALAAAMADLGLERGDRIALWMPNTADWVAIQVAASRIGASVVALNTRYKADEIAYILGHSAARALFLEERHRTTDFLALLAAAAPDLRDQPSGALHLAALPDLRHVVSASAEPTAPALPLRELYRRGAGRTMEVRGAPDDPLTILYTSGTTAAPKGVMQSSRSLVGHSANVGRWLGVDASDRVLLITPFCGIYGLNSLLMTLASGATGITTREFDPEASLDLVEAHRVTAISGTSDAVVRRWLEVQGSAPRKLDSLRRPMPAAWLVGDLPVEVPHAERVLGVPLVHAYGLSEANSMIILGVPEDEVARRIAVSGKPVDGVEVRIADPDSGEALGVSALGELCIRGPVLMKGYFRDEAATRKTIDADGWLHTGDLAMLDDAGYVHYRGRLKDIVKISGFTVSPAEVEQFLCRHPLVASVQVVGIRGADGHEMLAAALIPRTGTHLTEEMVADFCRGRIATYKIPARIRVVDAFPTTPGANAEKVQKHVLRRLFEDGR